jgi:antitoxin component YwqK of YwqJK toxin-antitoxin module
MKKIHNLLFFLLIVSGISHLAAQPCKQNCLDSLGRKQGYWKKYVKDTLKYEGTFVNDIPTGDFIYYYYDGKTKAKTTYSDNGKKAVTVMYFADGKRNAEGTYVDQKKEGLWIYYSRTGKKNSTETFVKGIQDGPAKYYYESGAISRKEQLKNGVLEGEVLEYFDKIDSTLKLKTNYTAGKINGAYLINHLNGKPALTGKYVNGIKEGEWIFYSEAGVPQRRIAYEKDAIKKEELILQTKAGPVTLELSKIAYCEALGTEVKFRLNTGEEIQAKIPLADAEFLLGQFDFMRVNDSFVVAAWAIKNLKTFDTQNPLLTLKPDPGKVVKVDSVYMEAFQSWAGLLKFDNP